MYLFASLFITFLPEDIKLTVHSVQSIKNNTLIDAPLYLFKESMVFERRKQKTAFQGIFGDKMYVFRSNLRWGEDVRCQRLGEVAIDNGVLSELIDNGFYAKVSLDDLQIQHVHQMTDSSGRSLATGIPFGIVADESVHKGLKLHQHYSYNHFDLLIEYVERKGLNYVYSAIVSPKIYSSKDTCKPTLEVAPNEQLEHLNVSYSVKWRKIEADPSKRFTDLEGYKIHTRSLKIKHLRLHNAILAALTAVVVITEGMFDSEFQMSNLDVAVTSNGIRVFLSYLISLLSFYGVQGIPDITIENIRYFIKYDTALSVFSGLIAGKYHYLYCKSNRNTTFLLSVGVFWVPVLILSCFCSGNNPGCLADIFISICIGAIPMHSAGFYIGALINKNRYSKIVDSTKATVTLSKFALVVVCLCVTGATAEGILVDKHTRDIKDFCLGESLQSCVVSQSLLFRNLAMMFAIIWICVYTVMIVHRKTMPWIRYSQFLLYPLLVLSFIINKDLKLTLLIVTYAASVSSIGIAHLLGTGLLNAIMFSTAGLAQ